MQKKSNVSTAMWFIPLLAILLASAFIFIYWVGRVLFLSPSSTQPVASQKNPLQNSATQNDTSIPILPPTPVEESEEEVPLPQEVLDMEKPETEAPAQTQPDICPSTTVATKIKKPLRKISHTPYERGLRQCKKNGIFPCAWEDKAAGVIKQYWLMGVDGPITRGVYDMGGNLMSETIATVNGTVTSYTDKNISWYFDGGVLVKIRTSPYDNCNFHDWFFINEEGKQDVCQCAYTTPDCCARSPYQEGMERNYCGLFPQDKDFCK